MTMPVAVVLITRILLALGIAPSGRRMGNTIGLRREDYGAGCLRQTKAAIPSRATGSLQTIQILLGYNKIRNIVRYLGVDIDDTHKLTKQIEI